MKGTGIIVKCEKGNVADIMAAGLCMLAMTAVMLAYMGNARLVYQRSQIGQIARKYILQMETTGELTDADRAMLTQELTQVGVTELDLDGTTVGRAAYGDTIVLVIRGKIEGEYEFEEKKVSTAKH